MWLDAEGSAAAAAFNEVGGVEDPRLLLVRAPPRVGQSEASEVSGVWKQDVSCYFIVKEIQGMLGDVSENTVIFRSFLDFLTFLISR